MDFNGIFKVSSPDQNEGNLSTRLIFMLRCTGNANVLSPNTLKTQYKTEAKSECTRLTSTEGMFTVNNKRKIRVCLELFDISFIT